MYMNERGEFFEMKKRLRWSCAVRLLNIFLDKMVKEVKEMVMRKANMRVEKGT